MEAAALAFLKDPEQKTGHCQSENWVCSVAELGQAGVWQPVGSSSLCELHGTPGLQEVPHASRVELMGQVKVISFLDSSESGQEIAHLSL